MAGGDWSYKEYSFGDVTGRVIRAAIEGHRELGPGFQEVVCQRGLTVELDAAGIDAVREENVPVFYRGKQIDTRRVDFVAGDCIAEIKARKELLPEDYIQTLCYLKASGYKVALLISFGADKIQVKRFVNDPGVRTVKPSHPSR